VPSLGVFVIACFRPHPGKDAELLDVVRDHLPILRSQGLVTDRPSYVMRAGDGSIVEVFEWKSADAIEAAHSNEAVQELWERFEAACEYEPIADLAEAKELFPSFEPVDV
jgi:quinol monooxygenase YgiN